MEKISLRDSNFGSYLWKVAIVAVGGAAALGLQAIIPLPLTSLAANTPTFARPVASGVQGQGYEQDIRIDTKGRVYTSVPNGGPSGVSWIWKSTDRGKTFKWVPNAAPLTGAVQACQGGGDTELATDTSDNLYFNILSLANFSTARSSDGGSTFTPPVCTAVSTVGVDRQWYATDGDPTTTGNLYLAYDAVVQGAPNCPTGAAPNNSLVLARSLQGAAAGVAFAPAKAISAPCDEGIMGNVEVSPTTHHIFIPHDTDQYDQIRFATCQTVPLVSDPTGLSCVDRAVTPSFAGHAVAAANFTTMGVDSAGKVYVAWAQANCSPCTFGPQNVTFANILGDTQLFMASSSNEGLTWSLPTLIPTTGLHNAVYPYLAAGDSGRMDVAYYGTTAQATCVTADLNTCHGPDSVSGDWGLYMQQTTNGGTTWTPPLLASEHFIHRGSIQTLIGAQHGDRTLGDFLQIRMGLSGEANIAYGDSTNQAGGLAMAQAMFVRQNGGSSLKSQRSNLCGVAAQTEQVYDPRGDATFDANSLTGPYEPNMDILESDVSQPDATHYQVRMTVQDLTMLAPLDLTAGKVLVWSTHWHVPSATDTTGGKIFHAYMESDNGAAPTFWVGENGTTTFLNGGNGTMTYPGTTQVTGTYTAGSPGVITISVPTTAVADPSPVSTTLFSVTASTQVLPANAESAYIGSGIGGTLFNLVDVAEPYDYIPGARPTKNQTTCGLAPSPSPRPSPTATPSGGGGGGHGDRDSDEERNIDDDAGINDTEYDLSLPNSLLNVLDNPPDVNLPVPSPSIPGLP